MKKAPPARGVDRRKRPRARRPIGKSRKPELEATEACRHCSKDLSQSDRALFVEEEVGRIFCSEDCIAAYFGPEIERLEKDYFRQLVPSDLSPKDREGFAHLRWITLQEPDEVWREKTVSGDYRYTLISEFQPGAKRVWNICICLFLRGEPSFLFLSFPTRNAALATHYRRGERMEWSSAKKTLAEGSLGPPAAEGATDRLADSWTDDETFRAQFNPERKASDISSGEFKLYEGYMQQTLEDPDEVWSLETGEPGAAKIYHFIREYADEKIWYLIVARETEEDSEEIEILDGFPTRDPEFVNQYRQGHQEVSKEESKGQHRVVH